MDSLLKKEVEQRLNVGELMRTSGQNDPQTNLGRRQLDATEQALHDEADEFMAAYKGPWPVITESGQVAMQHLLTAADVNRARMDLDVAKSQFVRQSDYARELSAQNQAITEERGKINDLTSQLNEARRYIEDLDTKMDTSRGTSVVEVLSHGNLAAVRVTGKTRAWTLFGAVIGAALPIVLLLTYKCVGMLTGN
jgi:uncharacterized protein involved in exopolysaccharide biosynthesis